VTRLDPPTVRQSPLSTGVRVVLACVALAPFVPPLTNGIPGVEFIGWLLDQWFGYQCHREPDRSLHLWGAVLPVCMRCLGIYLGLGLGAVVLRPRLSVVALRVWVAAAALLMIADVAAYWIGLHHGWTASRLITGVALSYPVGIALVQAARGEKV
jgi:uncharacterized membrane protein